MKTAVNETSTRPSELIDHEPLRTVSEPESIGRRAPARIVPQGNASALLVAITKAASDKSIDMDKMERLFKMHQAIVAQEAEAAFNAAMARAQAKIQPIVTDAENDHTRSRYATLAAINRLIVPIYSAEGLSVTFDTETKNDADPIPEGWLRTIAIVAHAQGFSRRYHIDLPPDSVGAQGKVNKTGVQAAGSTNEYARRYLVRMIFNLSTYDDTDDTDGNGADPVAGQGTQPGAAPVNGKPAYPQEQFDKNLPVWKKQMAEGKTNAGNIIGMLKTKYALTEAQTDAIKAAMKEHA